MEEAGIRLWRPLRGVATLEDGVFTGLGALTGGACGVITPGSATTSALATGSVFGLGRLDLLVLRRRGSVEAGDTTGTASLVETTVAGSTIAALFEGDVSDFGLVPDGRRCREAGLGEDFAGTTGVSVSEGEPLAAVFSTGDSS